jgi:hypothetical protein
MERGRGWKPYLEKFIKYGGDKSMEGGFIALEKPSSFLEERLHLSVRGM